MLGLGHAGWLALGAFLLAVGAAGPSVAAWAERTLRLSGGAEAPREAEHGEYLAQEA